MTAPVGISPVKIFRTNVSRLALALLCMAVVAPARAQAQTTGSGKPFQQTLSCNLADGAVSCIVHLTVPGPNILVVQSVSLTNDFNTAQAFQTIFSTTYQKVASLYTLPAIPAPDATPFPGNVQTFTAYLDRGMASYFICYRTASTGSAAILITVSGYLIPDTGS